MRSEELEKRKGARHKVKVTVTFGVSSAVFLLFFLLFY